MKIKLALTKDDLTQAVTDFVAKRHKGIKVTSIPDVATQDNFEIEAELPAPSPRKARAPKLAVNPIIKKKA